jgi:hypothetical protein
MAEAALLNTARGAYRLSLAEPPAIGPDAWILTLSAQHGGGLEKFTFQCRVALALLQRAGIDEPAAACSPIAGWLEKNFEHAREAALKSIRSERRLAEFKFDEAQPGPF